MIDIGKEKVSMNCPECKRSIQVSTGQISRQELVKCRCGQSIRLVDSKGSNEKAVRDINKAFKDLEKTFKSFGK